MDRPHCPHSRLVRAFDTGRFPSCSQKRPRGNDAKASCRGITVLGREQKKLAMSPLTISTVVFACVFGSGLLGVFLHRLLPDQHLSPETKEVVRLGWDWWRQPWHWCSDCWSPLPRVSTTRKARRSRCSPQIWWCSIVSWPITVQNRQKRALHSAVSRLVRSNSWSYA